MIGVGSIYSELNSEERLIILLSRLTFSDEIKEEIRNLIANDSIKWFDFYKLALYHKTITLCWSNIKSIVPKVVLPKYVDDISRYIYFCTKDRNQENQKELVTIVAALKDKGLGCIPVKGGYFLGNMYKDLGVRYSGDLDILIKHSETKSIVEVITGLGYICGSFDNSTGIIEPVTRKEEVKWKMYMSNLHPFLKLTNNELFPVYKIDLRIALDDKLNHNSVEDIIDSYIENGHVKPCYYLVHLCTHYYNEAKYTVTINLAKDMNLIKLCDIREYIIQYTTIDDIEEAIRYACKYDVVKAIYFTMYVLNIIYKDGYEEKIIEKLSNYVPTDVLETFGENTNNEKYTYKKTLRERIFSCDNNDELVTKPDMYK